MPARKNVPTPPAQPATPATAKVDAATLARYAKMAEQSLSAFETVVTVRQAPAVEFTEADRKYVRDAAAAMATDPSGWLRSDLPTEIPGEIAAELLSQRYAVIKAAAAAENLTPRRKDADKSNHVLWFRVTVKTDKTSGK